MALSIADAYMTTVQDTLLDPTGQYWTQADLIGYHNLFVIIAISEKPNLLTQTIPFELVPGVEQKLGPEAVQFLRAPANVVSGKPIAEVTAEAMQDADPDWYGIPPATDVEHVIVDADDPLCFRVHPPNDGTGQIYIKEAYAPNDATAFTDPFPLTEAYRDPARNAVLAMAYAKSTDRGDTQKSEFYFNLLDKRISQKLQAEMKFQPRTATPQTTE